jgi:hypothetical protein
MHTALFPPINVKSHTWSGGSRLERTHSEEEEDTDTQLNKVAASYLLA